MVHADDDTDDNDDDDTLIFNSKNRSGDSNYFSQICICVLLPYDTPYPLGTTRRKNGRLVKWRECLPTYYFMVHADDDTDDDDDDDTLIFYSIDV